jgi:hypothetical protein
MQAKRKKIAKKKNVGGRPALPEAERRDRTLDMVRFSVAEIDRIRARYADETAETTATFSQWLREKLLGLDELQ